MDPQRPSDLTRTRPVRVVHYLNQFFAGIGGETAAEAPPEARPGALGPGLALQQALGDAARIVGTVICGDGRFADRMEETAPAVLALIEPLAPDVVVAGPAFGSGRYGLACGRVCAEVTGRLGVPALTAMHPENAAVEVYRRDVVIVPTAASALGTGDAVRALARLALALGRGQPLGPATTDGYLPRGRRLNARTAGPASARALDLLLARLAGAPAMTEVPLPRYERVAPPPPVADARAARLALVTEGGLVPRGNPDRLEWVRASKWLRYSLAGADDLLGRDHEIVHGGYDAAAAAQDPDRLVPLDAVRELTRRGELGALLDAYYVTCGNHGVLGQMQRHAREIAADLRAQHVDAVLLVAT